MTQEEAEEIMMLMEEYGIAEYAKAEILWRSGEPDEMQEARLKSQAAWISAWRKLKVHIK